MLEIIWKIVSEPVNWIGLAGVLAAIVLPRLELPFHWEHPVGAWGFFWLITGSALGLFWAPRERMMGDVGRILYVHVPAAWVALLLFTAAFICALVYLMNGKYGWDWAVEALCEVGVVMNALLLALGSIFGHATWGTWWAWDPRLTSSLVMMLTFIGVLMLRTAVSEPSKRATWTAVTTIIAFINIPVTYMSVQWWQGLHQQPSTPDTVDPNMTLVLRMCAWAFILTCIWLTARRWRIAKANAEYNSPGSLPLPPKLNA